MQKQLAFKCIIIIVIGMLMLIPLGMIEGKIRERQSFQYQAREDIARSWTGNQHILTPIMVIPYAVEVVRYTREGEDSRARTYTEWRKHYLSPTSLGIEGEVETELRYLGIYRIPVYSAHLSLQGLFAADQLGETLAQLQAISGFSSLGNPYLSLHLADVRGISGSPTLTWQGQNLALEPDSGIETLDSGLQAPLPVLVSDRDATFEWQLSVRGMESLQWIPAAKQMDINLSSTWPHPQFSGAFLPQARTTTDAGFRANWRVNHFSTGIEKKLLDCEQNNCQALYDVGFGVDFVQAVNNYLQSERSVKYGLLFIGLTFAAFFIFETLRGIAIHPVQYSLVGMALAVFFLLLTALSEHLAFGLAYTIATASCVAILTYYLRYILRAWAATLVFSSSLSVVFGLLYVIVGAEDYALLMGSLLIFTVLSGMMIITRKINWYELSAKSISQFDIQR